MMPKGRAEKIVLAKDGVELRRAILNYRGRPFSEVLKNRINRFFFRDGPRVIRRAVGNYYERRIARTPFFQLHPYKGPLSYAEMDWYTLADKQLRVLFHPIPKCANSSLAASTMQLNQSGQLPSDQGFKRALRSHLPRPSMLSPEDARSVDSWYKFIFVRDPYSRLLSAYLSKVAAGWNREDIRAVIDFDKSDITAPPSFETFCRSLESRGLYGNLHWRPQVDFLFFPLQKYDFIGRFESIDRDFRSVALAIRGKAELDVIEEDATHRTRATDLLSKYYTSDLYDLIYRLYRPDFEAFGYRKK